LAAKSARRLLLASFGDSSPDAAGAAAPGLSAEGDGAGEAGVGFAGELAGRDGFGAAGGI
jgi:hypothetical protein